MENSIGARLDVARRELLDLSLNNRLLNYRLLRTQGVEATDELPADVYRMLVAEGRRMSFLPTAEDEESPLLGQPEDDASDGPAAPQADTRLRTDLPSTELQARLLSTYYRANSFIQDHGANILFLLWACSTGTSPMIVTQGDAPHCS